MVSLERSGKVGWGKQSKLWHWAAKLDKFLGQKGESAGSDIKHGFKYQLFNSSFSTVLS